MSDEPPINFNEHRAVKADDATLWTPVEALKKVLREIESGEISPRLVYIAMQSQRREDGLAAYNYVYAGGSNLEACGLLAFNLSLQTR